MASGLENIETIESPFRRFVTTIGVFPTAFTDAMTYYECLAYLVKYLEETVIPAVNENAEALEELQTLYVQLKSYVDNYFENLDVQEEINNKLDEMAEDGTLTDLLNNKVMPVIEAFESEVNSQISSLRTELNTIASGSPIPVASTDDMTDQSKVYVNTTDGKWYYYDTSTSTWTIGGTYQSTGLAEGSVSGTNLFNAEPTPKYKYTQNYIYGTNGVKTYFSGWELCEEYFPLQSGDTITLTNVRSSAITLWDSDKQYIQTVNVGSTLTDYTHTFAGATIAFMTVAFPQGYTHQLYINGVEYLNKWGVDWLNVSSDNLDFQPSGLDGDVLQDDSVYRDKLILSNGQPLTSGSFWSDGVPDPYIVRNNDWCRFTNLIPVQEGDIITGVNIRSAWLVMFDENGDATGNKTVSGITTDSYTVTNLVTQVGINIANNVKDSAEIYINGKRIYFDDGNRETIDWLTFNSEQMALIGGYDIERFRDYKVLFIGDSITESNYRASQNWVDYITNSLNITNYTNGGMSGTGILRSFGSYPNWLNKLADYSSDYDLILIMGDMNDWSNQVFTEANVGQYGDSTTDTFYGTMKVYLEAILTKYPLAKIGWITSTPRNQQISGTSDYLHGKGSIFSTANDVIKEMCNNYSIPVLELYNESSLYPWISANNNEYFKPDEGEYVADGIHPNSKGQKIMSYKIKDFIVRNF